MERIRSDLNVNMIARGGAPLLEGYCPCWDHTMVSLWSTVSKESSKAAVLLVSPELEVTPIKMLQQVVPIAMAALDQGAESNADRAAN